MAFLHEIFDNPFAKRALAQVDIPGWISDNLKFEQLSNAYLINKVQRMNVKGLKKFEIGEKYYFEDLGLRNCKQHLDYSTDINKLMENAVF